MLQQLARDVTGWPARAVEFFDRLTGTQYMNHCRPGRGWHPGPARARGAGVDRRRPRRPAAHRRDAPHLPPARGRYNIPNVGLFLWRVAAVPLVRVPLTPVGDGRRFRLDQLGFDEPRLRPAPDRGPDHPAGGAGRRAARAVPPVPGRPLRRLLRRGTRPAAGGTRRHHARYRPDLRPVRRRRAAGHTSPRPARTPWRWTRCSAGCGSPTRPRGGTPVGTYHYGSALELGAGGHDRGDPADDGVAPAEVTGGAAIQPALDAAAGGGIVELADSWRYDGTPSVAVDADASLTVRAANRQRPLLAATGPVHARPGAALDGGARRAAAVRRPAGARRAG